MFSTPFDTWPRRAAQSRLGQKAGTHPQADATLGEDTRAVLAKTNVNGGAIAIGHPSGVIAAAS